MIKINWIGLSIPCHWLNISSVGCEINAKIGSTCSWRQCLMSNLIICIWTCVSFIHAFKFYYRTWILRAAKIILECVSLEMISCTKYVSCGWYSSVNTRPRRPPCSKVNHRSFKVASIVSEFIMSNQYMRLCETSIFHV